ncbi:hypothetical protein FQN60_003590 [Etheostoma spectabile]|uniref:Uncharacterized protein n=1 Tax=Etheostoma spectabile TaxID=54343 RepID=A0A5J5CW38_9PERO|nr:hypothetical protein FQN60_003590 [Etheostoma spectabile]
MLLMFYLLAVQQEDEERKTGWFLKRGGGLQGFCSVSWNLLTPLASARRLGGKGGGGRQDKRKKSEETENHRILYNFMPLQLINLTEPECAHFAGKNGCVSVIKEECDMRKHFSHFHTMVDKGESLELVLVQVLNHFVIGRGQHRRVACEKAVKVLGFPSTLLRREEERQKERASDGKPQHREFLPVHVAEEAVVPDVSLSLRTTAQSFCWMFRHQLDSDRKKRRGELLYVPPFFLPCVMVHSSNVHRSEQHISPPQALLGLLIHHLSPSNC